MYDELQNIFEQFLIKNNIKLADIVTIQEIVSHYTQFQHRYMNLFIQNGIIASKGCWLSSDFNCESFIDGMYSYHNSKTTFWKSIDVKGSLRHSIIKDLI
jgi:hypothetical protein